MCIVRDDMVVFVVEKTKRCCGGGACGVRGGMVWCLWCKRWCGIGFVYGRIMLGVVMIWFGWC